ncbi:unnamed protein product [Auanema sp. JU1783]|nr:unnamed protein product [Auanema sp. JU1783]
MLGHQRYLRSPFAQCKPGFNNWNFGIVVEKFGGTESDNRREKKMYLYSKTIYRDSGKLVCSREWSDYKLGDWLYFNTMDDENFFNSEKIESPIPTVVRPDSSVMVEATLFLVPNFISHRVLNEKHKLWSPEIGLVYTDQSTLKKLRMRENRMYKCWVSWSLSPICFSPGDMDPSHFSYEPVIYWQLTHDNNEYMKDLGELFQYPKQVEDLRILCKHQTQLEVIVCFFRKYGRTPTKREIKLLMPEDNISTGPMRCIVKKDYAESIYCGMNPDDCHGIRDLKDMFIPPFCDFTVVVKINNNMEKRNFFESLPVKSSPSTEESRSFHSIGIGLYQSPFSRRYDIELRFKSKQEGCFPYSVNHMERPNKR